MEMGSVRDGKGINKIWWEGTDSRTVETKDGIPTVRKLGAADVAVLDDLPGEKTTTRQAARNVFA